MTASSTTGPAPELRPPATTAASATVEVALLCQGIDVDNPRDRIRLSKQPASGSVGVLADALGQLFAGTTPTESPAA